jgi:hypothetical protein
MFNGKIESGDMVEATIDRPAYKKGSRGVCF